MIEANRLKNSHCTKCIKQDTCKYNDGVNEWCTNEHLFGCPKFKDKSRFIELPCEPGSKVYIARRGGLKECDVVFIGLSADKNYNYINFAEYYSDGKFMKTHSVPFSEINKYVFTTKEEAEKTLVKKVNE